MKKLPIFNVLTVCIASMLIVVGCDQSAADKTATKKVESSNAMITKADPATLKAEIQELETAWAEADNARDVNALAAFYADDAISMDSNKPMIIGNAAIKKNLEASLAGRVDGSTVSYEVMDVFGSDPYVTEVGKFIRKDSAGKITGTGKYMALWENRDGKWICIRDIGNDDAKVE